MNDKGYYEFDADVVAVLEDNGMIGELFYIRDLAQRKLFLNTEISQYSVHEIVKHILQYNKEDKGTPVEERKPILLYLVSDGGDLYSCFELIDAIITSKTPVYTINLGYQYSAGFLIGLAGHKRFATRNATYLLHDGYCAVEGSAAKTQDSMEFQTRMRDRVKRFTTEHSKITPEEYDGKFRFEWYMYADEAKEKGIVDCIIGEDCDIDEVV